MWLKTIKLKKMFFLPSSDKSVIKNDLGMQLHSIFHKIVNRNKLKVRKYQRLASFSVIKKTVTGVGGGSKFFLSLSLSSSLHINFQYKLNSHKVSS